MSDRKEKILNALKDVMSDLGGLDRGTIADQSTFLELGFDSLFLAQMSAAFKKKFGVNVTFRQLLEETPSPEALAQYLDAHLTPEEPAILKPQPSIMPTQPIPPPLAMTHSLQSFAVMPPLRQNATVGKLAHSANLFERVMSQQLQVMARQLEVLRYSQWSSESQAIHTPAVVSRENGHGDEPRAHRQKVEDAVSSVATRSVADETQSQVSRFGPWKRVPPRTLPVRGRLQLNYSIWYVSFNCLSIKKENGSNARPECSSTIFSSRIS